ncbi:sensor histidine kinase [Paenibacillus sp. HB172176]|uniref:sensor histidine kinase n=1 Tax=Paenibacillus sp. HB172176 TaxID=2493690 RepID=UPI001438CDBC|nr:sensor histidine kinase [Paenibacillus sp. HB172176]
MSSILLYLRDRLLYLVLIIGVIGICVTLYLLEKSRYPGLVTEGTIWYFIELSLLATAIWLCLDYIRQRSYFKQLKEALSQSDELKAAVLIQSGVTAEQKQMATLLREQHRAYLNELGRYRRQQELHNHFVMQWVHHMKTPLSIMDLHLQDLLQGEQAGSSPSIDKLKELRGSLQEETERMSSGLDMMLQTARLEKFELDAQMRSVPLHELARKAVNAHKRLCIRHSIFPRIDGEAWAETDEKWMSFVLSQLISNAVKYSKSKPGGKQLKIRIHALDNGSSRLELTDEGIGIAPHDLPRVFEPFFTGENGRLSGESTGMGLYLAKQVCAKLGHVLTIKSELGSGTTAELYFQTSGIHQLGD